jgi:mono/diheme cytochrome c family protein
MSLLIRQIILLILASAVSGCAMSEEVKRIDESNQVEERKRAAMSNDLNGEQVFFRTCNECHPGGRANFGPALDKLSEHFADDAKLIDYIRRGKGVMPPVPKSIINDAEMADLITYLRKLNPS